MSKPVGATGGLCRRAVSAGCVYAPYAPYATYHVARRTLCASVERAYTGRQPPVFDLPRHATSGAIPAFREIDLRQVKQALVKIFKGMPQRIRLDYAILKEATYTVLVIHVNRLHHHH